MNKILLILVATLMNLSVFAQQKAPHASFKATTHDFGKIKEIDGPVSHNFQFTNTGSVPLIIRDVNASCGCTSPSWTKEPILPGKTGFIKATFNPKGRRNNFNKTITIKSNAENSVVVLKITGNITPREPSLSEKYPRKMGDALRLKSTHLSLGRIPFGQKKTDSLAIINLGNSPISLAFSNIPGHMNARFAPTSLKPKEQGFIIVNYDTEAKNDWDFINERLRILINGKPVSKNTVTVTLSVTEDLTKFSKEELDNGPQVNFAETRFNFGTIKKGEKIEHAYLLTNTGRRDLIIRKVKASCGCTAVQPQKKVIKPGESTEIKAIYTGTSVGQQNKAITVITNDPKRQRTVLRISGKVENNAPSEG